MKVGIVGLGRMGEAMARRFLALDHAVVGWDRDPAASEALEDPGFHRAEDASGVVEAADFVISCVTDDAAIRTVFEGPRGYLGADIGGKLFIEMSTLQPATMGSLSAMIDGRGAALIEAPVIGSVPTVLAGQLVVMAGGAASDIDQARPVLGCLAARIVVMGPLGSGAAMKLAVNVGLAGFLQSLAEGLALGGRHGLGLEQMLDVLSAAPTANALLASKMAVLKGGKGPMTLDIQTLRKDMMSAVATGALAGVPMPLAAAALATLSAATASGWSARDIGELPRCFRETML